MLCGLHAGFRRLRTRKDIKQRVNVVQYELHVEMVLMILLAMLSQIKYVIQVSFSFSFSNVGNAQSHAPALPAPRSGLGQRPETHPDAGLQPTRPVSPAPGRRDRCHSSAWPTGPPHLSRVSHAPAASTALFKLSPRLEIPFSLGVPGKIPSCSSFQTR